MEPGFWRERWRSNEIGFHQGEANALLVDHLDGLSLRDGARLFLPLCGKTRDIAWLMSRGFRVAGAELSQIAVDQLFQELGIEPRTADAGRLTRHSAPGIDIFVGDIFDLTLPALGRLDAVYDRAALVALPAEMRNRYTAHLMDITDKAPQFLLCYEYDQTELDGPPFSISREEVHRHYGDHYDVTQVKSIDVAGGLKGKVAAAETAWLLRAA